MEATMAQWNGDSMDRLYGLYERYIEDVKRDIRTANVELGSANPERVSLQALSRDEFEIALSDPARDREATSLWLRRIVRGHEQEFPFLQAAG
jgi:hypothetical protein